jgi:hypothetical protein
MQVIGIKLIGAARLLLLTFVRWRRWLQRVVLWRQDVFFLVKRHPSSKVIKAGMSAIEYDCINY